MLVSSRVRPWFCKRLRGETLNDILSSRERVLLALDHQETDRVPISWGFGLQPPAQKPFDEYLAARGTDMQQVTEAFTDIRGMGPPYVGPTLPTYSDGSRVDEWGILWRPQCYGPGEYHEIGHYPLGPVTRVSELANIQWPQVEWWDFAAFAEEIQTSRLPDAYAIRAGRANLFETATWMSGMEKILSDLVLNPQLVHAVMQRVTDFYVEFNRRLLQAARGRVHIVFTADDLGAQRGLLLSVPMIREFIMPYHRRINAVIHGFGARVMFHSDGAIMDIVPDLLDAGVDVLEALQFSADGMDPAVLKENHGDRLCFHGGISVQTTLPFGTVEDVKREVRERIEILGRDGGYILAPAHAIQAGTPPENVAAMLEEAAGEPLA